MKRKTVNIIIALLLLCYITINIILCIKMLPIAQPPKIKYAEFPFTLCYEVNGETKEIKDTIVCKFDGFELIGTAGVYRQWDLYLKSGAESIQLLDLRTDEMILKLQEDIPARGNIELYFYYGNAMYYMGDNQLGVMGEPRGAQNFDQIYCLYQTSEGVRHSAFTAKEAWEKYELRLISWECAPPVQNSFSLLYMFCQ